MCKIKQYYSSEHEFNGFYQKIKMVLCPHCRQRGCLILHGYLYGYGDTDIVKRGHRIFCSNRNKRSGCGRTFSMLRSVFMKHFMIGAGVLSNFLDKILQGFSIAQAFRQLDMQISQSSIYHIFKRFKKRQPSIRTHLLRINDPPALEGIKDPVLQTIFHLKSVFKGCSVSQYQDYFQIPFL